MIFYSASMEASGIDSVKINPPSRSQPWKQFRIWSIEVSP